MEKFTHQLTCEDAYNEDQADHQPQTFEPQTSESAQDLGIFQRDA